MDEAAAAMAGERTARGSSAAESAGEVAYVAPDIKSGPLTHNISGGKISSCCNYHNILLLILIVCY